MPQEREQASAESLVRDLGGRISPDLATCVLCGRTCRCAPIGTNPTTTSD